MAIRTTAFMTKVDVIDDSSKKPPKVTSLYRKMYFSLTFSCMASVVDILELPHPGIWCPVWDGTFMHFEMPK